MDRAIGSLHTVAATVKISSTLRAFVIRILVPMRTEHDKRNMTRNINVRTFIKGDLLVSVMTSCVGCILGKAIAIKVR
jgi:hypothetical protein